MIKICGAVLMLIGLSAYTQTSDLWFAQGFLLGVFFCFSEALFAYIVDSLNEDQIDMSEIRNVRA